MICVSFSSSTKKRTLNFLYKEDAGIHRIPASWHPELDSNQRPTA